ncbi:MAG TPA: hypothetical protein VEB21_12785 [Terriglobales bacterium]|nr:hypothetical protein [Terriglobales bacterium]
MPAAIDRRCAAIGLVTVALANLLFLRGLAQAIDPMLSMDPYYIAKARQPLAEIVAGGAAWGPLYALWLKPWVAALGDPLRVYTANVCALSVLVTVLLYLHLLLLTRRAAVATGGAALFLISDLNVPLFSKVSAFAVAVLLAGWIAAQLATSAAWRGSLAAAAILLAGYARPELYPASLILLALMLVIPSGWSAGSRSRPGWWGTRQARRARRARATAAVSLLLVGLALTVGLPIGGGDRGEGRLLQAFREHFAWSWNEWHDSRVDFQTIWQRELGGATSLTEALAHKPAAVLRHGIGNAAGILRFLTTQAFDHYPVVRSASQLENAATTAAVLALAAAFAFKPPLRRRWWASPHGWHALVACCSVAAAVVIHPSAHYLIFLAVTLLVAAAAAAARWLPPLPSSPLAAWAAALACLLLVPRPFTAAPAGARKVTDTVHFVRSLNLAAPVRVLTANDGLANLLGEGFEEVRLWQKGSQPLSDYLHEQDIALVVALELQHQSFAVGDPSWTWFQNAPETAGYGRLAVPGHPRVGVFVRRGTGERLGGEEAEGGVGSKAMEGPWPAVAIAR